MSGPAHLAIRRATAADLDRICGWWAELAQLHAAASPRFRLAPGALRSAHTYFEGELSGADSLVLVADLDGAPAGFANAQVRPRPPVLDPSIMGHVDNVYVVPAARRAGVASALLAAVRAWFEGRGLKVWGTHVHAWNEASLALCARHGLAVETLVLAGEADPVRR